MINFRQLCEDRGVDIAPPSYTCTREGWINIQCPFCDDTGYRMGYNEYFGYFSCFRCGWHGEANTLHKLLSGTKAVAYALIDEYKTSSNRTIPKHMTTNTNTICEMPEGSGKFKKPHYEYLKKRNFKPWEIAEQWGLEGTIHSGAYAARIVAPITFNGVLCSYQGRDITGTADLRYKACQQKDEVISHQHLVYGFDQAIQFEQCVVVEGITDVWRLGFGAVCVFGIEFTDYQVRMLASNFKKVYIAFDQEPQAQKQATKLNNELSFRGVECEFIVAGETDPAEMEQEEADKLMRKLGFLKWNKMN